VLNLIQDLAKVGSLIAARRAPMRSMRVTSFGLRVAGSLLFARCDLLTWTFQRRHSGQMSVSEPAAAQGYGGQVTIRNLIMKDEWGTATGANEGFCIGSLRLLIVAYTGACVL